MWAERGIRTAAILALLVLLAGLIVLALPDEMEGQQLFQLDAAHSLHIADIVGTVMVLVGAALTWVAVWTWQRKTLHE